MALLQISEPGQAPDPHQRRIAVGIDLGTTHSLVAALRHGHSVCLPDAQGRVLLPSVLRYLPAAAPHQSPGRQIGWEALQAQTQDPANTISSVKRLMGRTRADLQASGVLERLPYTVVDGVGMAAVRTVAGDKSPVEVSAEILATLRQRAEDSFDAELYGAVITVPAYFDDAQRQATKDAAQLAGLKVLRLLNEPTAAALAYGLDQAAEGLYAVFDLGGGTFDVSLLRLSRGVFEVLATGGDSALGGDDYDRAFADALLQRCGHRGHASELPLAERAALLAEARRLKEALCNLGDVAQTLPFAATLHGQALQCPVSRAEFDAATAALTERTVAALRRVLRDARVTPEQVQGVVLVGGATRMPALRQAVATYFGRAPLTDLNPDEVVALGAALQAQQLAGNPDSGEGWLLLDVTPLSLGLETMGGLVERIVPRNTPLPAALAQDFTTYQDGQTALALHVLQGEARPGARLPQPGAFRAARHPAHGGRGGAHPRHLPPRRRRAAERERARAKQRRRGAHRGQTLVWPERRTNRRHAARGQRQRRARHARARLAPGAGGGRSHGRRHPQRAGRRRRAAAARGARRHRGLVAGAGPNPVARRCRRDRRRHRGAGRRLRRICCPAHEPQHRHRSGRAKYRPVLNLDPF